MSTIKLLQSTKSFSAVPLFYIQRLRPLFLTCLKCNELKIQQIRCYQKPPQKVGLFSRIVENVKDGFKRDKQMQENLKKFQEEAQKFEESDAIKEARQRLTLIHKIKENVSPYYNKVEETLKDSSKTISATVEQIYKDAKGSDVFKKGLEVSEEISKSAKEAAEKISKQSEEFEKTQSFKTASQVAKTVKEDLLDDIVNASRPYQRPEKLRRRTHDDPQKMAERKIEVNEDTQDMVLHKDAKWQQQWKDFRDNNPVVTGLFSLKTKYDESDNVVIRATRVVTDKMADVFSDVFSQSEQAQTLSEIAKIDPSFNKDDFLKECEFEIIPTVLEAFFRADMDVLQDWCHEGVFSILSQTIQQGNQIGLVNASKILDIRDMDLALAKVMEPGPVLVIRFTVQQVNMLQDKRGKIVEGAVDNIENVDYVWALCRDQSIFDHRSAWRILEFGIQDTKPYV